MRKAPERDSNSGTVEAQPNRKLIGTFHKTGSVLWQSICKKAAKEGIFSLWDQYDGDANPDAEVVFSFHAHQFHKMLQEFSVPATSDDRWLICIRDPRAVIVSAAHYHCKTEEAWCHVPDPKFGGMTYQDKINSFSNFQDKLLFEMDNSGGQMIQSMVNVKGALVAAQACFVKIEDLMLDTELGEFRKAFAFLGFDPGRIVDLLAIAVELSIFSDPHGAVNNKHVRSASPSGYLSEFDERTMQQFHALFPDCVAILGYPEQGVAPAKMRSLVGRTDQHGRYWPSRRPKHEWLQVVNHKAKEQEYLLKRLTHERDEAIGELKEANCKPIAHLISAVRKKWTG